MPSSVARRATLSTGTGIYDPDDDRPVAPIAASNSMSALTEFFCWWIIDEQTGERRLTRFKLTRVDAQRAFPGAEPDVQTREVRYLSDDYQLPAHSRPDGDWC